MALRGDRGSKTTHRPMCAQAASDLEKRGLIARSLTGWGWAAILVMTGCGGGGGSGGNSAGLPVPTASASALVVADGADGTTQLSFDLNDPTGNSQMIEVEYSEDRGATFRPATLTGSSSNSVAVPTGGGSFSLDWIHTTDLAILDQSDLCLRVTPIEAESGRVGESATSEIFGMGNNNAPSVSAVTTPTGIQGGIIEIPVDLSDAESDFVAIDIEYSVDGGGTWAAGTTASTSPTSFATSPSGVTGSVHWHAQVDSPGTVSSITHVRLTPVDLLSGSSATSGQFSVFLVAPDVDNLTIGDIPKSMNGSTSYTAANGSSVGFRLRVPTSGTQVQVETSPGPGGAAIDPATLRVTANQAIGSYAIGDDLGSLFSGSGTTQTWTTGGATVFPIGAFTLFATIEDVYGNVSESRSLTIEAHPGTGGNFAFDWADRWWLDFSLDQFSITSSGTTSVTVTSTFGPNGTPDHIEDLRIAGLQSTSPSSTVTNTIVRNLVEEEVLGRLRELFGGDFDGTTPGYAPNLTFSLTQSGSTSSIRVGGDDSSAGYALGRAMFDHRNATANHNRTPNLGVFSTNLIEFYVNSFYFRQRFGALMPGIGTPVGEDANDAIVLDPSFDRLDPSNSTLQNLRYDAIWDGIEAWGRGLAVIAAHEVGHSIGLCSNGAPPEGLFGGMASASFAGPYTTSYHIDTPGNNLMAAALSFSTALLSGPSGYHFNELNEAYLRQWHLLGL